MTTLPLHYREGHLFLEHEQELWLVDTGAPGSFGTNNVITLENKPLQIENSYLGLTANTLSRFVGVNCTGLLGADVLGQFDFILDVPNEKIEISSKDLECPGTSINLNEFMGIPIAPVRIRGKDYRMFLDSGARVSYFQNNEVLVSFPAVGSVSDFYPGFGQFETDTHNVDLTLGHLKLTLRCGVLPGLLGATLLMAGTEGIVGNQIFINRMVGFFPRRRLLVL